MAEVGRPEPADHEHSLVEIRCPQSRVWNGERHVGKLFAVLHLTPDGDLYEVACQECARRKRQLGERVKRVLHRYSQSGELVETITEEG